MLNYEYPPLGGGASPVSAGLAENLAVAGHEVDVLTMGFAGLPSRVIDHSERLRVIRVPCLRRSKVQASTPEMASYLVSAAPVALALASQRRYDVVHAHFLIPTGPLALLLKATFGLPVVVTLHGSDVPGYNPDRFQGGHRLLSPIWGRLARACDAIISPSRYLGELAKRYAPIQVTIIPNAFNPIETPIVPKRQQIAFVGRLFQRKGAHFLLEALQGLELNDWQIVIVGDGPERERLITKAEQAGLKVCFPGFLQGEQLWQIYAESAIFVMPSLHENFPIVLLEALGAGCAVIANAAGGMPEVIGDAGILVPAGDITALREGLCRLLDDTTLRDTLQQQALQQIEHFRWSHILSQHLVVYQSCQKQTPMIGNVE